MFFISSLHVNCCLSVDITLYAFFIYVIFQDCKNNQMMELLNEGKKKGATKEVKSKKI
jgi:hypothetical protein